MNLDHSQPYIFTIEQVLSPEECADIISYIEESKPQKAPIRTLQGEKFKSDVRNNERAMKNDPEWAELVFNRIKSKLPTEIAGHELVGLNELFRFYRYKPGMHFAPHSDGVYIRNEKEKSFYTFLIYLNEVEQGGDTSFDVEPQIVVKPETGLGLLFQHQIIHEGQVVEEGVKYVVRSDIMYRQDRPE